jgi:hypothetical protein
MNAEIQRDMLARARHLKSFDRRVYDRVRASSISLGIDMFSGQDTSAGPTFDGNFGALMPGVALYLKSDLGVTKTGSTVNAWANQAGAASNVAEGSAGVGLAAATGSLNGKQTLISNGTTHFGTFSGLGFVAPATANWHVYAVARFLTNNPAGNHYLTGANDFSIVITQLAGQNNCELYNGATVIQTTALNTWARFRISCTGSTSDVWRWGATQTTGASFGNQTPSSARGLFAAQNGTAKGTWEVALLLMGAAPLATMNAAMAALDAGVASDYGVGVAL